MPFDNLSNKHFSATEKTTITNTVAALETAFAGKLATLTPEERTEFGSINEQNKLVTNKVKDYRINEPALSSPDVDWTEYMADFDSRALLQATILRVESLLVGLKSAKIAHDFDDFKAALVDYDFSKYKLKSGVLGFETKVNEIAQFFIGGNRTFEHGDAYVRKDEIDASYLSMTGQWVA